MSNFGKNLALWVIIGLLLVALFNLFQQPSGQRSLSSIPFSDFLAEVSNGQVREVTIKSLSNKRKYRRHHRMRRAEFRYFYG